MPRRVRGADAAKKSNHFSDVGTLRKYACDIFLVSISAAMPP